MYFIVCVLFLEESKLQLGFPHGSAGKEFTCNAGDLGSIPGLGREKGKAYSGLENSMGYIVHGVAKSRTQLSSFNFQTFRSYK